MAKIVADVLSHEGIPEIHQRLHRLGLQGPRPPMDVEEVQSNDLSDARSRCPEMDDLSTIRLVLEVGDGVGGLFDEMGFLKEVILPVPQLLCNGRNDLVCCRFICQSP